MITDNIKNSARYFGLHKDLQTVFEIFRELLDAAPNRIEVEKNGIRCNGWRAVCSDFETDGSPKVLEAHENDIDVHMVLHGEEAMAFEQAENLEPICEYNPEKDYILLKGASNKVILRPGDFMILYPGEAHRAALDAGNGGEVFRCNVRIRIKGE